MKRILIIDDEKPIRTIFKRFLSGKGYTVDCVENGQEALHLLETKPPDLVITDIMMPKTDGIEVVMAIRDRHAEIPIIAISGGMHARPMDFLPMAKKLGACKVLYKPVELEDLLEGVHQLLDK